MDSKLKLMFFCHLALSPWVSVALQVLSEVPKEMLLREEQSHAQRQQLPALQEEEEVKGGNKYIHFCHSHAFVLSSICARLTCVRE